MQQKIQMVDLHGQYMKIKAEIDAAIAEVIDSSAFINGPAVGRFASALAQYTGARHVIPCGNGTDALQIALMALGLKPGDEVIVPAFTYVASAEVIALLGLRPVMVDVDCDTFNTDIRFIEKAITPRTRAISTPLEAQTSAASRSSCPRRREEMEPEPTPMVKPTAWMMAMAEKTMPTAPEALVLIWETK